MQNLCNEKLKLNKFIRVDLPSNKVLFQRCQGITIPRGSSEIPTADFTSRNLEAIRDAESYVNDDYAQHLRENQMPIDTPLPTDVENVDTE